MAALEAMFMAHVEFVCKHPRSEEHTSELQSHHDLVCRTLIEKKKKTKKQKKNKKQTKQRTRTEKASGDWKRTPVTL